MTTTPVGWSVRRYLPPFLICQQILKAADAINCQIFVQAFPRLSTSSSYFFLFVFKSPLFRSQWLCQPSKATFVRYSVLWSGMCHEITSSTRTSHSIQTRLSWSSVIGLFSCLSFAVLPSVRRLVAALFSHQQLGMGSDAGKSFRFIRTVHSDISFRFSAWSMKEKGETWIAAELKVASAVRRW